MTDEQFKIKLDKELNNLADKFVILLNTDPEYYFDSVAETVKVMTDRGMTGIYVTSARPYGYIVQRFKEYNINTQNLFFIDLISCMAGKRAGEEGNCIFIENPVSLDEIEMWINTLMKRNDAKNKFLIVDSLSSLLIYNRPLSLKKFTELLVNYLRRYGVNGIFTTIDSEKHEVFQEEMDIILYDKTINI